MKAKVEVAISVQPVGVTAQVGRQVKVLGNGFQLANYVCTICPFFRRGVVFLFVLSAGLDGVAPHLSRSSRRNLWTGQGYT